MFFLVFLKFFVFFKQKPQKFNFLVFSKQVDFISIKSKQYTMAMIKYRILWDAKWEADRRESCSLLELSHPNIQYSQFENEQGQKHKKTY